MLDFILALISTITGYAAEYNATHLLSIEFPITVALIFLVVMPLMMWTMRETPTQTITRVTPMISIYDSSLEQAARAHAIGHYTQDQYEARVAKLVNMRQPLVDELARAHAAVAKRTQA